MPLRSFALMRGRLGPNDHEFGIAGADESGTCSIMWAIGVVVTGVPGYPAVGPPLGPDRPRDYYSV